MSYLEIINAFATIVIAVFAIVAVCVQWKQNSNAQKIANANYILALHDRRLEFLIAVEKCIAEIATKDQPGFDIAAKLYHQPKNHRYILPGKAQKHVKEIMNRAFEYDQARRELENTGRDDPSRQQRQIEVTEKLKWFADELDKERLRTELSPYLTLPPSIE
ncbi:hypothetical protein [Notoacmeibacter sp. MSK16QG-6]|uniref:hypothetical protein n=1 Tax=Notoacmeibacter sp. MSK16QG-6 TaxID=2957982 RepID=UPI00209F9DB5|nr:hypothetical protein [Notoacmeibacter sp. MSK16QG-6]MCP1200175.1 hypothetical protein [Notoacmeibacter sp. MSK16QG-6]